MVQQSISTFHLYWSFDILLCCNENNVLLYLSPYTHQTSFFLVATLKFWMLNSHVFHTLNSAPSTWDGSYFFWCDIKTVMQHHNKWIALSQNVFCVMSTVRNVYSWDCTKHQSHTNSFCIWIKVHCDCPYLHWLYN